MSSFKSRTFHWRTLLAVTALNNLGFAIGFLNTIIHNMLPKRELMDEAGAVYFGFFAFVNLFSVVNAFFFKKLELHIFIMLVFCMNVVTDGLISFIMVFSYIQDPTCLSSLQRYLLMLLLLTFFLSVSSLILLLRNMDKALKTRT